MKGSCGCPPRNAPSGSYAGESSGWSDADLDRVARPLATLLDIAAERERAAARGAEAEAARQADAAKTVILHAVSHDLRSPLTSIRTAAAGLREQGTTADDRIALIDAIEAESDRLTRLIGNLLDLSRIEAGAVHPRTDWCDLLDVISTAVSNTRDDHIHRRIQIELDGELPLVRADASQLERVFSNLIENALRFSPENEPVRISGGVGAGKVTVRVVDRGPGVPVSQRNAIFKPFHTGDRARGRRPGARDLQGLRRGKRRGAASAGRLRRRHRVRRLIPAGRAAGHRRMSAGEARVLVVDDEPQIVRGLRVILTNAGYRVEEATTKQEALDAVSVRPPDAIVLDLVLPDGDGIEVARDIRRWSQVPIVVLSAVGDERQKVRALDAGRRRLRHQALRQRGAARQDARGAAAPK